MSRFQNVAGHLGNCVGCSSELPLRLPQPRDASHGWMCVNCRAVYHSVLIPNSPPELRKLVRPAKYHFNDMDLPEAPRMLEPYVKRLNELEGHAERRDSPRRPYVVPAAVMPLDKFMHPAAPAFWSMTKDISASGLCLFTRLCVTQPYIAVQLDRGEGMSVMQFILKIARRIPVGLGYQIAGPVAAKLGDTYMAIEAEMDELLEIPTA